MPDPTVETPLGQIVGTRANGVRAFRGIPFAAPLTPGNRFLPPEPPAPRHVIDATAFGPAAPQNPDKLDAIWGEVLAPGSEDCLTLNVWAPDRDGPPRPVLVWVHGGAFLIGSGRWPWSDGAALAARGDLVVVSINYRLGALGFLDLSAHGPEFATSANLGLLDIVRALEWVRDRIAHFGGDPANVTISGQSAGAIAIGCLLGSPRAKGLFRRAALISGGPNLVRTREFARSVARRFMGFAGAKSPAELRTKPVAELLAAQHALMRTTDFGDPLFGPTVDGDVLPDWPLACVRGGSAAGVQLLVGSTKDEFRLWGLYVPPLRKVAAGALRPWLRRVVGDADLLAAYRAGRPGLAEVQHTFSVMGDFLFRLPVLRLAEAQVAQRPDTRVYRFDWETPAGGGWMGSPHSLDAAMLFGNLHLPGLALLTGTGPDRVAVAGRMGDAWAAFARAGDPSPPEVHWPSYDLATRPTMLLGGAPAVANDPAGSERAAWGGVPFDGSHPATDNLPRRWELLRFLLGRLAVKVGIVAGVAAVLGAAAWFATR